MQGISWITLETISPSVNIFDVIMKKSSIDLAEYIIAKLFKDSIAIGYKCSNIYSYLDLLFKQIK